LLGDFVIELIPEDRWAIGDFSFLNLLREGLAGGFAGIAIALPYVLLFYLILGFTEDIGLLPRFVVNIEKIFAFFGLPSKSFITMILGVGCTVPAITSTRIIHQKSDRLKTAFLLAFIPCSSRIGIIMGVIGFYGGFIIALATFGTIFIAMMIWAFIMKWIMKAMPEPMLIELPAYRRPIINNVFSKSWLRMKSFIYVVIPLLIGGGIIYSILDQLGVTMLIIEPFRPFMEIVFNLPGETIVPLVFGFVQKDLTGAMLLSVFEIEDGLLPLTNIQLYTFGLASCIGVPCIIALGTMFKEYGLKNSLITLFSMILYGTFISNIAWRVAILFI
ncbi:MAG: ferrous iron transporter B, partial [Candidatus Lokiarchaeota archaeon]|nr:ferrous iron transporter B [Candidatus Lokiarchaeota archaeon]